VLHVSTELCISNVPVTNQVIMANIISFHWLTTRHIKRPRIWTRWNAKLPIPMLSYRTRECNPSYPLRGLFQLFSESIQPWHLCIVITDQSMVNGTIIFASMDLPPTKPARYEKENKSNQNRSIQEHQCYLLRIPLYTLTLRQANMNNYKSYSYL